MKRCRLSFHLCLAYVAGYYYFLATYVSRNGRSRKSWSDTLFQAWKQAWPALLLPFGYGFLEASLHSMFPIYALRNELSVETVAMMLPAFALGGIAFQLPLGTLSDRFSRKTMIMISLAVGALCFAIATWFSSPVQLTTTFSLLVCLSVRFFHSAWHIWRICCQRRFFLSATFYAVCYIVLGAYAVLQSVALYYKSKRNYFLYHELSFAFLLFAQRPFTKFSK